MEHIFIINMLSLALIYTVMHDILSFPSPKCCGSYIKKLIIYKLFQWSMTPRHRYDVHGQYRRRRRPSRRKCKRGRRPSKRFPTLQQLSSVVLVRAEVYKVVGITDVFTVLSIADWARQSVNQCPEQNLGICETSLYTEAAFLHKQFSEAQDSLNIGQRLAWSGKLNTTQV